MDSIRKYGNDTYFIKATKFIIWINVFFSCIIALLGLFLVFVDINKDDNNKNKISTVRLGSFITILGVICAIINYYVLLKYVNNDIVKVFVWISVFSYLSIPYRIKDTIETNIYGENSPSNNGK